MLICYILLGAKVYFRFKTFAVFSRRHFKPLKMDLTEGSETSANIKQTLGKHPKVNTVNKVYFRIY
jgi:hypothetical protein